MELFNEKTVYILDSYGLIYRCYFAFVSRPLTNSTGQNISALFGFFRNFHSFLVRYRPDYIAAAFDSRTPTFRHDMYPEYKATRQKTPDDLHAQVPWIEEILSALGVPVLRCDGFEADDVIATVATQCTLQGRGCRILSGDKDLAQLVCKTTEILKPDTKEVWKPMKEDGVKSEWGVSPEKMLDLLSLVGDKADNIPGVKGIGQKTACKLLECYGSLDGIYTHAEEIKGAVGDKIKSGKESAYFSQKLIKLRCDVSCRGQSDILSLIPPVHFDFIAASEILKKYGAPSVAKKYAAMSSNILTSPSPKPVKEENAVKKNKGNYHAVTDIKELKAFIDDVLASDKTCAFDTETDSLNTLSACMIGFSLCHLSGSAIYVPLSAPDALLSSSLISLQDALLELERLFNASNITVIMHNGKFDYEVIKTAGIKFTGQAGCTYPACRIADTMIAAWLLEPDRTGKTPYSLEYLAETKLFLSGVEYSDIVQKGQTFSDVPLDTAAAYSAEDADFTWQLWKLFKPQLEQTGLYKLFSELEMKVLPVLAEMEIKGIHLDTEALKQYSKELCCSIENAQKGIYELVGHEFNIASTKQLQDVLFIERKLKPGKKTKTGYSTDTAVLEELAAWDPVPKKILEYREMTKLRSTYVETLPKLCDKQSRVHTSFIQTGTATGRLSSRDPNLQNIPVRNDAGRRIRAAFRAQAGTVLISADYSQIELAILAHLSSDPNMCAAFKNGVDIHKATASMIFGVTSDNVSADMRRTAKTINFGVIYGMSAFRLSNQLGIPRTKASEFIEAYFKTYSSIQDFINTTVKQAEQTGYVQTISGRRRYIRNINSSNKLEKAAAERVAVNTPVQGSAADIVKLAMIRVDSALHLKPTGARLLLQVHDELILEAPDDKMSIENTIDAVKNCMESAYTLQVPLKVSVEYGYNWGAFH